MSTKLTPDDFDAIGWAIAHPKRRAGKRRVPESGRRRDIADRIADRIDGYDRDDLGESPD